MNIWTVIITMEATLFVWGFLYGLLYMGDKSMNWFVRALSGATFFALFYIAIPAIYIQEYLENKK